MPFEFSVPLLVKRSSNVNMVRLFALAGLATLASAMELTESNYKAEVIDSGKNAFIKFLAPW